MKLLMPEIDPLTIVCAVIGIGLVVYFFSKKKRKNKELYCEKY